MGHDEKEHQAQLSKRLRVLLPILVVVSALGCAANVWFSLDVRDEAPRTDSSTAETAAASWDPQYENLQPHKALPTWLSYFVAFGLGLAAPAAWVLSLAGSYGRWKVAAWRAARAKRRTQKWSGEVGRKTLCGKVVEIDGGADEAFLVEIEQQGEHHTWNETSRRRATRPFTMELSDGQRLRVEPDDNAQLVDSLDPPVAVSAFVRLRRVRLTLGEEVCVVGRVESGVIPTVGYRGGSKGLVMRAPKRGRMLLSTEALERLFTRRARSARNWLIAWTICLMGPCWLGFFPFWLNATSGEPLTATVVAKRPISVRRDKKKDLQTVDVTFRVEATGQHFNDWVAPWEHLGPGARVPVFMSPGWVTYARLGKSPTVDIKDPQDGLVVLGVFGVIALTVVFGLGHYIRTRPWWEQRKLDETGADVTFPEPS